MSYESFENYQYDSCTSRGICSINPINSALQTVLVLYLRLFSKFAKDIEIEDKTRAFVLNTVAITIYNLEFNENSYLFAVENFKAELPRIMELFAEKNPENNLDDEKEKALELFNETSELISAIKFGEKIYNRALQKLPSEIRDLYSIMLVIAKSLSINLLDYESYEKKDSKAFSMILNLFSNIKLVSVDAEALKNEILEASKIDNDLMRQIRESQEERYGKQVANEVSYTTSPNKAVLVVGSNIRELEIVLEALKYENIDVYTHDEMMLAHTFPKFEEYPNLKGQFGQGLENCLLDFATFPGPIILTKHSLHNIENFYRGLLFTTDYITSPKGIIKIDNNDFSKVVSSAEEAKGFKTGRQCESVIIGYDFDAKAAEIKMKLENEKYKRIFIIGLDGYSLEQRAYFEKLLKLIPQDCLIISFSYNLERENLVFINTCFDNYSWVKIFEYCTKFNLPIELFVPKCEKNTISQLVYLSQFENVNIYLGKCTPIILNPTLLITLLEKFSINSITSAKKDLEEILKDK